MPRLFVGTFLSPESIDKIIELPDLNSDLGDRWNAKIRWTDKSKLHLTWVFLGEVEKSLIPDVISAVETAITGLKLETQSLAVNYEKFELWPDERNAKLAVFAPHSVPPELAKIKDAIKGAVSSFIPKSQLKHEFKSFRPHITVLRFNNEHTRSKNRSPIKGSDVKLPASLFPIRQSIEDICLIESRLNSTPSTYETLASFPLFK